MIEPMYENVAVLVVDENCVRCQNFKVVESENETLHCEHLAICLNALDLREGEKE